MVDCIFVFGQILKDMQMKTPKEVEHELIYKGYIYDHYTKFWKLPRTPTCIDDNFVQKFPNETYDIFILGKRAKEVLGKKQKLYVKNSK